MLVLLVAVIAGIAIAYFGMQNVSPVTIRLNDFVWNDVPLYLVMRELIAENARHLRMPIIDRPFLVSVKRK